MVNDNVVLAALNAFEAPEAGPQSTSIDAWGVYEVARMRRVVDAVLAARVHAQGKGYTVDVDGQHFTQAQWEAVQRYCGGSQTVQEEPQPQPCSTCGADYDDCTKGLFGPDGKACCSRCAYTDTHQVPRGYEEKQLARSIQSGLGSSRRQPRRGRCSAMNDDREAPAPSKYTHSSEEHLLWNAGELIRSIEKKAAAEQAKRSRMLAENKVVQARIREFLTSDELTALNAAGLGGVITRVAAGLNSAGFNEPVRMSVTLPKEEKA